MFVPFSELDFSHWWLSFGMDGVKHLVRGVFRRFEAGMMRARSITLAG